MKIQLAKSLDGIKMYGPIYDFGTGKNGQVIEYVAVDENDWFLDNMIDKINITCDTLLDDGDFDYISAEKCKKLIDMINGLPNGFIPVESIKIINVLLDFAKKAVNFGTGIEIEM